MTVSKTKQQSCVFHNYFADLSWLNVRMRPRHSHSLHPDSSFHGKDMHMCTVQVCMLWITQVHMVRHNWHFRAYSSLCLFLWCSETKGFSEDNKRSFRSNWLLSDIVVCRFPKWNQTSNYKSKNYVFIKFDMKRWKQSVNRDKKKVTGVLLWLGFEQSSIWRNKTWIKLVRVSPFRQANIHQGLTCDLLYL